MNRAQHYCSKCGKPTDPDDNYCDSCGAKIISTLSWSDQVNVIRGNVDHSTNTRIDQQVNIGGDVHLTINKNDDRPTVESLLGRGISFLNNRAFDQAIQELNQALLLNVENAEVNYYLALACLQGKLPRELSFEKANQIDEMLRKACSQQPPECHYYYLWAWIRSDYLEAHPYLTPAPKTYELLHQADQLPLDQQKISEMVRLACISSGLIEFHINQHW
jgi:hypothetical protein